MISKFVLCLIGGTFKKVETVTYNNGKQVERIYPVTGNVPEEIREIPRAAPQQILNMEHMLYEYWHGARVR